MPELYDWRKFEPYYLTRSERGLTIIPEFRLKLTDKIDDNTEKYADNDGAQQTDYLRKLQHLG